MLFDGRRRPVVLFEVCLTARVSIGGAKGFEGMGRM